MAGNVYHPYHLDSYLKEIDAVVTGVDGSWIVLDHTVFYPQGGAQPGDHGTLAWNGSQALVTDVRWRGDQVWHQTEGPIPPEGTRVHGVVDWTRRHALMRTHTALHVLNGVIWRDFGALVTGVSMEPCSARIDFELERMTAQFAGDVEASANAEIAADRVVRALILPRAEALAIPDIIRSKANLLPPEIESVRVVEIVGLDTQADGGTHVRRTGEIGRIRITGHESKGRINKRLRLVVEDAN